ncbi:ROK family protein [Roseobacter sp. HKCC-CH-9208]|uniref:ROK family protein n=1 Tax=Roseobacter sp. HKCC-CH-9208 TaxID=3120339 RepID=UPI0030EC1CD1
MKLNDLEGFAIDLGGTKVIAARIVAGEVVAREITQTIGSDGPHAQVDAMARIARKIGYLKGEPLGVAVAGRIDAQGHWHAVNARTLSAISSVPLADLIAAELGPVNCLNDAAAAALAEARFGAGKGITNFAFLTVSTGIGGGLVLMGRLLTSPSGLAGHVGFATAQGATSNACGSGRKNTVESIAGGQAMALVASDRGIDARAICAAALRGEAWAEAIVENSAQAVGTLIADLTAILGLQGVAIGGSIGLSDGYIDRVRRFLDAEPPLFRVPVQAARLGANAPLFGALLARLDEEGK